MPLSEQTTSLFSEYPRQPFHFNPEYGTFHYGTERAVLPADFDTYRPGPGEAVTSAEATRLIEHSPVLALQGNFYQTPKLTFWLLGLDEQCPRRLSQIMQTADTAMKYVYTGSALPSGRASLNDVDGNLFGFSAEL